MKKIVFSLLALLIMNIARAQLLFTYGENKVSAADFLKAYSKNKTDANGHQMPMQEYLQLFINFKLKVQAAKDARLDTLPNLQADLQNFRDQIEPTYMQDPHRVSELVSEAMKRSHTDINVVDFFIKMLPGADSSLAPALLKQIGKQLADKKKPLDNIIVEAAAKGFQLIKNELGYVTVFSLPYEFENIVYSLPLDSYGEPHRTSAGWHILKNDGVRPAVGKITVAQILLATADNNAEENIRISELADSLYKLLNGGADFGTLAKSYSNDRTSFMNGGELPAFGVGKYESSFQEQAFALKSDNDISKPFRTSFGIHILKRLSHTPVAADDDESARHAMSEMVKNDSRIESARRYFIANILPRVGFSNKKIDLNSLWTITDTALLANKNIRVGKLNEQSVLFSFNDNKHVTAGDWLLFLRQSGMVDPANRHASYSQALKQFIDYSASQNYRARLTEFDTGFAEQIKEFSEGNMLFEIMEREVWGKAAAADVELKNHYEKNKGKYKWEASADAILFSCNNRETAARAIKELNEGKSWHEIAAANISVLQTDSGRYELSQVPVIDRTNFTADLITAPVVNDVDGIATFAKIIRLYPAGMQRSFEEARGMVVNDYQSVLEKQWIEALKNKYPVRINERVLQQINNIP